MLKKTLTLSLLTLSIQSANIHTLLNGVKHHYKAQLGSLDIKKAQNALDLVHSQLYPKIELFGSTTHYTSATNLRPTTPTESANSAPNFPFSRNINRIGLNLSMPIFVKSLYTLADQARLMQRSARAKREIDILKDEATLIGSNANLRYLQKVHKALLRKRKTLLTTKNIIKIKVQSGRAPQSALFKIQNSLSQINIAINNIDIQKENIFALIKTLSGINIRHAVSMYQKRRIHKGAFLALKPLRDKYLADKTSLQAQKEKLLPSLYLQATVNRGYGKSYLTKKSIHRDYGSVGLALKIPILDVPQYKNIEKAKLQTLVSATQIAKTKEELKSKATSLQRELHLLRNSINLNRHNITNQRKLLSIAKSSYDSGRMDLEEYLRYVDALVDAQANLYKSQAQYWQTLAQIAFIYGNDLEHIVK